MPAKAGKPFRCRAVALGPAWLHSAFGGTMRASRTKRRVLVVCAALCLLVIPLTVVLWQSPRAGAGTLSVRLVRQIGSPEQPSAVFTVSNSTGLPIGGRADSYQIYTNGAWSSWFEQPGLVFYLQPGETTNVQVFVPQNCKSYRVPFLWDYNIGMTPLELLRLRVKTLTYTLRTSRRWYGWRNTGSSTCNTSFWNAASLVDAEPSAPPSDGNVKPVGSSDGSETNRHR